MDLFTHPALKTNTQIRIEPRYPRTLEDRLGGLTIFHVDPLGDRTQISQTPSGASTITRMSLPWMLLAQDEIGTREVPGPGWKLSNTRIEWYHGATRAGPAPDDVAWCSSFPNRMFLESGIEGTRNKAAKSWLGWAQGVLVPIGYGAVGVLRTSVGLHCGFVAGYDKDWRVVLLGGNQRNMVCYSGYRFEKFLGFMMPKGWVTDPMPLVTPDVLDASTR